MKLKFILPLLLLLILNACTPMVPDNLAEPTATVIVQNTSMPTSTPKVSTITPSPTATITSTPGPTSSINLKDIQFTFISETIPDGTRFDPGEVFHKTWTIKNNSDQAWDDFSLAVESSIPDGETLDSPSDIPLPASVDPAETVEIAIDLTTPQNDGVYTVYYHLQDQNGNPIENTRIWVSIVVGDATLSTGNSIYTTYQSAYMESSKFNVSFCMQMPDERQWYPWGVILNIAEGQYQPSGSRIDPAGATTNYKCFAFSFPKQVSSGTTFELSIERIELPPEVNLEENCQRAQTTLQVTYPGLDFSCTGPGSFYTNLVLPPNMTAEEADRLILDAMSSTIYGPWMISEVSP